LANGQAGERGVTGDTLVTVTLWGRTGARRSLLAPFSID